MKPLRLEWLLGSIYTYISFEFLLIFRLICSAVKSHERLSPVHNPQVPYRSISPTAVYQLTRGRSSGRGRRTAALNGLSLQPRGLVTTQQQWPPGQLFKRNRETAPRSKSLHWCSYLVQYNRMIQHCVSINQ